MKTFKMLFHKASGRSFESSLRANSVVYGHGDALIMKKLEVKDVVRSLAAMYKRIDARIAKYGALTSEDVQREIEEYRAEKRRRKGA